MRQYLDMLEYIMVNGVMSEDRTGVGTKSIFGYQCRFDLQKGFPLVTTKYVNFDSVSSELIWFLEGSTDERRLAELRYKKPREELVDKKTIWTANADSQGVSMGFRNDDLVKHTGKIYGFQWRNWNGKDQLAWLLNEIKTNPNSRRLILSAWNFSDLDEMILNPCHVMAQFYVRNNKLSCQLYQRSTDSVLGAPYNIASYALLTHIIAKECNLDVGDFVYTSGDAHIYSNHFEQVEEQLKRKPLPLPELHISNTFKLNLNNCYPIDIVEQFSLKNYQHHAIIKAKMAV